MYCFLLSFFFFVFSFFFYTFYFIGKPLRLEATCASRSFKIGEVAKPAKKAAKPNEAKTPKKTKKPTGEKKAAKPKAKKPIAKPAAKKPVPRTQQSQQRKPRPLLKPKEAKTAEKKLSGCGVSIVSICYQKPF